MVDGCVVDGVVVEGCVVDGWVVDGSAVDGCVVDGSVVEGCVVEGVVVEGCVVVGSVVVVGGDVVSVAWSSVFGIKKTAARTITTAAIAIPITVFRFILASPQVNRTQ